MRCNCLAHVFAERVEQLIEEGKIPEIDEKTELPTNVVEYVWQMGDAKLENLRMTYREQREGFLLLRDVYGRLIERTIPIGHQIGVMHIGMSPLEEILADIDARGTIGAKAFDLLVLQYSRGRMYHIRRIQRDLPGRLRKYYAAVKADLPDKEFMHIESKTPAIARFELPDTTVESPYAINNDRIQKLIEADYNVRRIVFATQAQEELFRFTYCRSRTLIYFMAKHRPKQFPDWWFEFVANNCNDLQQFADSWKPDVPDWPKMQLALENTLKRTVDEIKKHYVKF